MLPLTRFSRPQKPIVKSSIQMWRGVGNGRANVFDTPLSGTTLHLEFNENARRCDLCIGQHHPINFSMFSLAAVAIGTINSRKSPIP